MSIGAALRKRARLYQYRERRVAQTAGYDWSQGNHNRIELVNRAVADIGLDRCRYLEIGCASNLCFNAVAAARKVGVDPARGGTVRATSDAFFKTNAERFDVIFVDGLHTYAQARRDALNGLNCLAVGGLMLFHDMLPNCWEEEAPEPIVDAWVGDVWKLGVDLAVATGVSYRTIAIDHGVGVLRKLDAAPRLPDVLGDDTRLFGEFLASRARMSLTDFDGFLAFLDEERSTDRGRLQGEGRARPVKIAGGQR